MTIKRRALLIVLGFILFAALAPTVILAARGYWFDFEKWAIVKTGILVVKSDPRGAVVDLDGQAIGETPLIKRFLPAGRHTLTIKKDEYRDWLKQVTIRDGFVTEMPAAEGKLFLLFEYPKTLASVSTTTLSLPGTKKNSTGDYSISEKTNELVINQGGKTIPVTLKRLPNFKKSQIIATPSRELFLLLDDTLYQVTDTLNKINNRVAFASWDDDDQVLLYGNEHEIWLWRPLDKRGNELIDRTEAALGEPVFAGQIGYFFFSSENKIFALEYDPEGQPNQYVLAETKAANVPLQINSAGDELTYLDSGQLVILKIR